MKLATYKDGSRDGQLLVVSRDLSTAHYANGIASRLQQVLDDWNFLSPQLQDLYTTLNQGKARHAFAFEPRQCMAPLPRAYGWLQADAWPAPAQRQAGAEAAADSDAPAQPPLLQGASDDFLGPCDDAWFGSAAWDIDFGAGLAAITGDVDMGASAEQGLDGVRLLVLANLWRLRALAPTEHALPAPAFGPVAITPDELGEAWQGGRVHLPLLAAVNGRKLGQCPGAGMAWHFGELIARAAKTRNLRAGCMLGAGPARADDAAQGVGCLADKRALETALHGEPRSAWLALGDTVRLELKGRDGQSLFGALAQRVVGPGMASAAEAEAGEAPDAAEAAAPRPTQPPPRPPDGPGRPGVQGGRG
ncbi:fumarylacetoacetate hydrolase family protein [Aquabacterium sp. OR-4]|uniref:fumarylacetoacetate hydrolase family protein n=1 Tax=Aquabacterium sp. OR-4 TaxID=2978127 RepID=UPI0028C8D13F|nr:fumarylacetoacetate hydrolase family protein [Aquabacterium sp. OR-4]MDT7837810.1 fumarylacetoacetate hydrolase family protein [Aquabacterium sp. OR-4]